MHVKYIHFFSKKCITSFFCSLTLPLPILLCLFPADTKRKVEQISEELRSLDEMLAGNEGSDGAVEVTAAETSPAHSDDQDQTDGKGAFFSNSSITNLFKYIQSYIHRAKYKY